MLTYKEVKKQSLTVFEQFGETKWIPNAKYNATLKRSDTKSFQNIGLGKYLVCAVMGASLENAIPKIKKYRDRFDLFCCDKAMGVLLDRGITPDFVHLADANVSYKDWCEKWIEKTKDIKLISTVHANTEWTKNWKGERFFYVNKDAIKTEEKFKPIFDNQLRVIPASSNVSNAMVVFMTGSDNEGRDNYAGYEKILLVGYDYSWKPKGNYYAFSNPIPKRYYMTHRVMLDFNGDIVLTSENLLFSAKWLFQYVTGYKLPVVNCSESGLLDIPRMDFETALKKINNDKNLIQKVRDKAEVIKKIKKEYETTLSEFNQIRRELWR